MELATEMVDEAGIHDQAAVFYAFHRPMAKVAKLSARSGHGLDYCHRS
ncbi:MAG: hypothetical protein ACJZ6A_00030 [Candidatus Poseidoniaceae archaeon]